MDLLLVTCVLVNFLTAQFVFVTGYVFYVYSLHRPFNDDSQGGVKVPTGGNRASVARGRSALFL
jgi:hypothetical protein